MSAFRRLQPHQLQHLSDGELAAYIDTARDVGDQEAQRDGVGYLVWSMEGVIKARVRSAVPTEDVEDVFMDVLLSVTRATFDGKLVGEFGSFVKTITQRRVADFYRARERRLEADPLAEEHERDDEVGGGQTRSEDETGVVGLQEAIDRVIAERNPLHQKVIRLYGAGVSGFEDLPADEVCDRIAADGSGETVSADNVAQIWSRFKRDLREELDV